MIGLFCYIYFNSKSLCNDVEARKKVKVLFEGIELDSNKIFYQCFVLLRTWLSIGLLVLASNYPNMQTYGLAAINFLVFRMGYEYLPFSDLLGNISFIGSNSLIIIANLLYGGLINFGGSTNLFNVTTDLIFYCFIGALAIPFICNMFQIAGKLYRYCGKTANTIDRVTQLRQNPRILSVDITEQTRKTGS